MIHTLKCQPPFFAEVAAGRKTFELRRDDRGFAVGDLLCLREWIPDGDYTGEEWRGTITYILRDYAGIEPGFCIMGLKPEVHDLAGAPESYREFHRAAMTQFTEEVDYMRKRLLRVEDALEKRLRATIKGRNTEMRRLKDLIALTQQGLGKKE